MSFFFQYINIRQVPWASVLNTSHGTWRMLMHEKPCLIPILQYPTNKQKERSAEQLLGGTYRRLLWGKKYIILHEDPPHMAMNYEPTQIYLYIWLACGTIFLHLFWLVVLSIHPTHTHTYTYTHTHINTLHVHLIHKEREREREREREITLHVYRFLLC